MMPPTLPCPAPARWWQMWASGLLLHWQLRLDTYSVGFVFFPPSYVAFWDSKTPHRPTCERVSYCLETSPPSWLPAQDRSPALTLLSLFLSFIFCPTSFWREWAAFLGAWCPPPAFRCCFVEVAQHSNDPLVNLWVRKWSPRPILLPSWNRPFLLLNIPHYPLWGPYNLDIKQWPWHWLHGLVWKSIQPSLVLYLSFSR